MTRVKVLQGCSIEERGMWFHQGAVLDVEDPAKHVMVVYDAKGNASEVPAVEPTQEPVNIPEGLFPKEIAPEEKE